MYNSCIIMLQTTPILFCIIQCCAMSKLQFQFLKFEPACSSNLCLHVRVMAHAPTHPVSSLHFCVFKFVPVFARDGARHATSPYKKEGSIGIPKINLNT
jgi:hypothetical protein